MGTEDGGTAFQPFLRAVAIALLALVASPTAQAQQAIEWKILNPFPLLKHAEDLERLANDGAAYRRKPEQRNPAVRVPETQWDPYYQRYDPDLIRSPVIVRIWLKPEVHGRDATCTWLIDGVQQDAKDCGGIQQAFPWTQKRAQVLVHIDQAGRRTTHTGTIEVRSILIVSLGDSYASGEGVPDVDVLDPLLAGLSDRSGAPLPRPAGWWDQRCHRSLNAAPAQAAMMLALRESTPQLQVVFLSFACSGAEITAGLLKPYAGRQTYGQLAVQLRTYLPNTGPVAANRLKSRGPGSVGKGQEFECRRVQVHKAGAVYGAKTCDRSGGCPETLTVREPMLDCRGVVDREIDHDIDACDALCVSTATGLQHSDEAYVGYLPSQLNALLDAICERPSTGPAQSPTSFSIRPCARFERPIDALWLSIGGNDVGFGLVLKTALLYANAFDLAGFRRERENEVGRLAEKYNELADALRDHVASKQEVKPEIFLTQYPDPTYANVFDEGEKDQRRCGVRPKVTQFQHRTVVSYIADLFFFRGASENEIGDLRTHVVDPLQGAVKEAAKAHEWTLVDGHVEPSEMHGYCNLWKDSASDPWFHTHDDSLSRQGNLVKAFDSEGGYSTGVMHPNILGLRSMADALVDESVKKLRIQTSK